MPFRPFAWLAKRLEQARLSTSENDNTFTVGVRPWDTSPRDRYDADRESILQDALDAWRLNPLARRIVGLTTHTWLVGKSLSTASTMRPGSLSMTFGIID